MENLNIIALDESYDERDLDRGSPEPGLQTSKHRKAKSKIKLLEDE
jgi:hypothetical protein